MRWPPPRRPPTWRSAGTSWANWHSGRGTWWTRRPGTRPGWPPTRVPAAARRAGQGGRRPGTAHVALAGYARLTRDYPTPGYFLEYAELLRSLGRDSDADAQVALADAAQQLFTANGGVDDLTGSAIALAQDQPAARGGAAQREWQRRQFADVADALAWALHAAGQDAEALPYARQAGALGPPAPATPSTSA